MFIAYHLVPADMRGYTLHPLAELQAIHPDLHAAAAAKYAGRERVAETRIPTLGCRWSEVIFLAAVPPRAQQAALRAAGFNPPDDRFRCFAFDCARLDPERLTAMVYRDGRVQYAPIRFDRWGEYTRVPDEALAYYRACHQRGQRPLRFHLVPHILFRGTLDVSQAEIVSVS